MKFTTGKKADGRVYAMTESVSKLTGEISCIMGGNLHSVWLYGSIVLGDFRLGWSDIDFIAFTNTRIAEN